MTTTSCAAMLTIRPAKRTRKKKVHAARLAAAPAKVNPMEIAQSLEGINICKYTWNPFSFFSAISLLCRTSHAIGHILFDEFGDVIMFRVHCGYAKRPLCLFLYFVKQKQ